MEKKSTPAAEPDLTGQETQAAAGPAEEPVVYSVNFPGGLNVRQCPGLDSPVLRVLPYGAPVMARGEAVAFDGGEVWLPVLDGYVVMDYLTPEIQYGHNR